MVAVEPARPEDLQTWLEMRVTLWPEDTETDHRNEIEQYFAGEFPRWPWTVLLAKNPNGDTVGFAEVSVRPYAVGCEGTQVAYLEGWFVVQEARNLGVGKALILAAEEWGLAQGCSEFASDVDADNDVSKAAHTALGFEDVGIVHCFRKDL